TARSRTPRQAGGVRSGRHIEFVVRNNDRAPAPAVDNTGMPREQFHGRRAMVIENAAVRVTVLEGGGHIAAVTDKASGVSPLWVPPWPSIEPAAFGPEHHAAYGASADGQLLAGIMGHNLCLDIFGGPSAEEAAAGLTAHGEGSVATYAIEESDHGLVMRADLPLAQLQVEREIILAGDVVRVRETVENRGRVDRPIGWTEHVTLGPPFLERGVTEFRASATRSQVFDGAFGAGDYLVSGATFEWPDAPLKGGGHTSLAGLNPASSSSAYTTHLMDQTRPDAFFVAYSPRHRLAFGYAWRTSDFPWMGIWEENHSRTQAPWNGTTLTRGMEFGVSPFPESRREMVERQRLFGVATYRWLPARSRVTAGYAIVCRTAAAIPDELIVPG
ncbi:MAG: hypothetical protein ABIX28_25240, partial [Vicinamibacterales bacterium]